MGIIIYEPAPLPQSENDRNKAVENSGLLNSVNSPRLNNITTQAKNIFHVDWSGVTIVYKNFQHVIASSGGLIGMHRRSMSMSSYLVTGQANILVILDTNNDLRFKDNPFVAQSLIGFYAGATIYDHNGYSLGALCLSSKNARNHFSEFDKNRLIEFSKLVSEI